MLKLQLPLAACCISVLLAGCASTTIYPEGGNKYSLVSTSGEQGYAEKDAQKKAAEHCTKLGKSLVVISHQTVYQGANKDNAAMIGLAASVLTGGRGNPARSNDDYQVTMKFKCE